MFKKIAILSALLVVTVFSVAPSAYAGENETVSTAGNMTFTGLLTAISGVSVPASLTVTVGATVYTVEVTTTTEIVRRFNGQSDLNEFIVGDAIEVRGTASADSANVVTATRIRDVSVQRAGGTFKGSITALDCANSRFTFKPRERVEQTVYIGTATKIIRGGEKVGCADLKVNEEAKVIGLWRQASNRIDADRIIVKMQTVAGTISEITLTSGGLPATITLQHKNGQPWTINVTSATKLFRRYMGTATIDEFAVGDKIEARGTRATGLVINAKMVRDNSISIKNRDFKGLVISVDATAQSFTMPITRKEGVITITVTTSSSTKFYQDETEVTFDSVMVGGKVKVLGVYNSNTKTLAATRVIIKD